jgi:hypothetical protein
MNRMGSTDVEAAILFLHLLHDGAHKRISLPCCSDSSSEIAVRLGALNDIAQFEVPIDGGTANESLSFGGLICGIVPARGTN